MENSNKPLISLEDVSAAYGAKTVLHDISLCIHPHDFLLADDGYGNPHLVRVTGPAVPCHIGSQRLLKPKTGTIAYYRDGQPCDNLFMGYLPQQTTFDHNFPVTVKEVVLSGALNRRPQLHAYNEEEHDRALSLLEKMELGHASETPIGQLSGGERQRALLARALMCQPEVLILDEPNTFFDIKARTWMLNELKALQKECTIIMVSHDLRDLFSVTNHIAYIHRHLHIYDTAATSVGELENDIIQSNCM